MDKDIKTKHIIPAVWEEIPACECGLCPQVRCDRKGCKKPATIAIHMMDGQLFACRDCFRDHLVDPSDRWKVDIDRGHLSKGGQA